MGWRRWYRASKSSAANAATIPALPSIEVVGISSERIDTGPMVRHSMSAEVTVSHSDENGADALLDSIVRAVRLRLSDAAHSERPISLADGGNVLVELGGTRWSVSATAASGVIRGASVALSVEASE